MAHRLSILAFVLAFPGFFIYHTLAAFGIIPLFVGGWASAANLFGCITLLPFFLKDGWGGILRHALFILLIYMVAAYAVTFELAGEEWQRGEMTTETFKLLLGWACLYGMGYLIDLTKVRMTVLFFFCVMTAIPLALFDGHSVSFVLENLPSAPKGITEYTGMATAYLVVSILALAMTRSTIGAVAIAGLGTFTLFLLSSRSDMGAFVLIVVGFGALKMVRLQPLSGLAPVIASALALYVGFAYPSLISIDAPTVEVAEQIAAGPAKSGNFRNEELMNLGESQSLEIRSDLARSGLEALMQSPLFGDYGGQTRDNGAFGTYIHNILSVWQQYGLATFGIFCLFLFVTPALALLEAVLLSDKAVDTTVIILLGGACAVLMILFKSVFWPIPALVWGLAARRRPLVGRVSRKAVAVHDMAPAPEPSSTAVVVERAVLSVDEASHS